MSAQSDHVVHPRAGPTTHDGPNTVGHRRTGLIPSTPLSIVSRFCFAWIDSIWLALAVSLVVGFIYAVTLIGPAPLNPQNISWLGWDPADHYIGWELFRQDPHWHWPLTYTNRVGYPAGESVALMDPNSLLLVSLKPLSPWLPEPFQYFGIEAVLVCALQFFFSIRFFRLILGENPIGILLASLFFLVAPPLAWRLTRHFSLSNQWLLIGALLVFFKAQRESPDTIRSFVVSALALSGLAIAINPYLAVQVLMVLTATVVSLLWQRRLTLLNGIGFMAVLVAICAVIAYSLGLLIAGGQGYGAWGYRVYSLNLLAPFDPSLYGSVLARLLPRFSAGPIHSGNYLGAGVIFLAFLLLVVFALQKRNPYLFDRRQTVPLLICFLVLTLLALSTKVSIGSSTLVDFDPQQKLTRFLAPLRASERLFWVPYYTFLTAVLATPFVLFRRSQANLLLAIALLVQLVDTAGLRHWVRWNVNQTQPQPLQTPIWSKLGSVHNNLVVLPAWQCGRKSSPGGEDGFRIFGLLAAEQRMRTNSYYSARYTAANFDFHCHQSIAALAERPLSPDTAYVVTPALAAVIAQSPTGPGKCHNVDSFILCSTKLASP